LLGPNGAGKTTTLRMVTGVIPYSVPGTIKVFGQELRQNANYIKTLFGVIPEVSNAFLDYTVSKNVFFAGRINGLSRHAITERMNQLLADFGLMEKINIQTKALSKGLKQRLSFCMNLVHDPAFLILDEPTSGLDPLSVQILRNQILELRKEGKTILLTTHDMKEAEKLCDRVLIMNNGILIADNSPDKLRGLFGGQKQIAFKPVNALDPQQILNSQSLVGTEKIRQVPNTGYLQFSSSDPLKNFVTLDHFCTVNNIEVADVRLEDVTLEDTFIHLIRAGGEKSA